MKERKRLYNPVLGNHIIEDSLVILGMQQIILAVFCINVIDIKEVGTIFLLFALGSWISVLLLYINNLCVGYSIDAKGIQFRKFFKKNKIAFKDINCIIISNQVVRMGIAKTAWLSFVSGDTKNVIKFCQNYNKKHVLINSDVKNQIVSYSIDENNAGVKYYGFAWNTKEMKKIFEAYDKDYYVAASIIYEHGKYFRRICDLYNVEENKIHIVDDSIDGKFVWNQFN